jgi:hypothetical protein
LKVRETLSKLPGNVFRGILSKLLNKKGGLNNGLVSSCYSFSCGGRNNLFFDEEKEKMSKRINLVIRAN